MRRSRKTLSREAKTSSGDRPNSGDGAAARPTARTDQAAELHDLPALSRRIIRWSSNLLATAVIIMLGLTLGQQVIRWWGNEAPDSSAVDSTGPDGGEHLADPRWPHRIAFGDLPFLFDRVSFVGTEQQAVEQLRARCRQRASRNESLPRAKLPASDELLTQLAEHDTVEQGRRWRLVEHVGPVITVVALRTDRPTVAEGAASAGTASQNSLSVVSWGLGLRGTEAGEDGSAGHSRWTLYICSGRSRASELDAALAIPLPPDSRRVLTAQAQGGGALVGFAGPATCSSFKAFFDDSLESQRWFNITDWEQVGQSWNAQFRSSLGDTCDIHLLAVAGGETMGIITIEVTAREQGK